MLRDLAVAETKLETGRVLIKRPKQENKAKISKTSPLTQHLCI